MANPWEFRSKTIVRGNGNFIYIAAPEYKRMRELTQAHDYIYLHRFLMDRFLYLVGTGITTKHEYVVHRNGDPYDNRISNLVILDRDMYIDYRRWLNDEDRKALPAFTGFGPFKIQELEREVLFTPEEDLDLSYDPYDSTDFMKKIYEAEVKEEERIEAWKESKLERQQAEQLIAPSVIPSVRNDTCATITIADGVVFVHDGYGTTPQIFSKHQGQVLVVTVKNGKIEIKKANTAE